MEMRWFCCCSQQPDVKDSWLPASAVSPFQLSLTGLKPAVRASRPFFASRRHRPRCGSVNMHVLNIDLCIPVHSDMCRTCWINCICINAWQQRLCCVLVLEWLCMDDLVAQTNESYLEVATSKQDSWSQMDSLYPCVKCHDLSGLPYKCLVVLLFFFFAPSHFLCFKQRDY